MGPSQGYARVSEFEQSQQDTTLRAPSFQYHST